MSMSPEYILAVESGIKQAIKDLVKAQGDPREQAASDQTLDGLSLSLALRIDKLTIGHDIDKAPTCSIPLLPTLALLVKRMGSTRDAALDMLKEVMLEALELDKNAAKKLMEELGVAEAEQAVKERVIGQLPRTKVKKAVKAFGVSLVLYAEEGNTDPEA